MPRSEIAQGIGLFLLVGLIINGCVHSCKKHKDDPEWLQNTPIVAYRGVEYFWHDDFAGVDWNERLKADARSAFILMDAYTSNEKVDEITSEIESFSKKINKYPTEKLHYIQEAANTYLRFYSVFFTVSKNYCDSIISGNYLSVPGKWNKEIKPFHDSLVNVYEYDELKSQMETGDSVLTMLALKAGFAEYDEVKEIRKNMEGSSKHIGSRFRKAYKMIFKKDFAY